MIEKEGGIEEDLKYDGSEDRVGDDSGAGESEEDGASDLSSELAELQDRHLRLAAEFDNFRRRSSSELGQAGVRGQAALVGRLVDVLDDLDRVTALDPESATAEAILEGVAMLEKKLIRALEEAGLERIDPLGEPFDPNLMEALLRMPTDDPEDDDRVGQLLQIGFCFKGQLIRPARVGVLKYDE